MLSISFELPESAFSSFKKTPGELSIEMKKAAVVKFYETGDLSQNKAAEILGVSRLEFLKILSSFKVSILDYDSTSIKKELTHFLWKWRW